MKMESEEKPKDDSKETKEIDHDLGDTRWADSNFQKEMTEVQYPGREMKPFLQDIIART